MKTITKFGRLVFALLFLGYLGSANAQYLETFSVANKGYQINLIDDLTAVNWSLSPWNTGGGERDASDYFNTTPTGKLECIDLDQVVYWESPLINTTAANPVSIKMKLAWFSFDSDGTLNNCITDYIKVEYSVNGGAYVMIPNVAGGNDCATVSYPFTDPGTTENNGSYSINYPGITGGSTLKIRIRILTNNNAEMVTIDDVEVPEAGVTVGCAAPVLTAVVTQVGCSNPNSGAIDLSVSAGTPPYTYAWTGGATSQDLTNKPIGAYTVTVTDAASCSATSSVTITNAPPLVLSTQVLDASCSSNMDGEIDLIVTGGVPNYSYAWTGGANTQDRLALGTGTYSVTVTDASGCSTSTAATVAVLPAVAYNEQFTIANKGYLASWVDNFAGVNWTMSGWTKEPPAAFGRDMADIFQTTGGVLRAEDLDEEVCWESPLIDISNSTQFSEFLSWTGFDPEDYITIYYSIDGGAFQAVPNLVGGGAGTIQYLTLDNANAGNVVTPVSGTTLKIKICGYVNSNDENFTIDNVSVPGSKPYCPCPNAGSISGNTAVCTGATTQLSTNGTSGGTWSSSNTSAANIDASSGLVSGVASGTTTITYSVTSSGCTSSTSAVVTVNAKPVATITPNPSPVCQNSSLNLSVPDAGLGASYNWSGNGIVNSNANSTTAVPSATGLQLYAVTVTAANACSATSSVSVTVNAAPSAAISFGSPTCEGIAINLSVPNAGVGASYNWSGPNVANNNSNSTTATPSGTGSKTYMVTVTAANGCSSTSSNTVVVNASPNTTLTTSTPVCLNASFNLSVPDAGMGATYSWSGPGAANANAFSTTATPNVTGPQNYLVTVTNGAGCTATNSKVVTVNALPATSITGGGTYCGSTTVSLSAPAGAASYAWGKYNNLPGAPAFPQIGTGNPFSVTKSGYYSVTVTNAGGCSAVGFTDVIVADYTINGSLGPGDTQKPDRLFRIGASGVTCAAPKSCPGTTGGGEVHYYDVHNFTNTQNVPVCVNIALNSPCGTSIFMAAYSAPFNPANSCANYLGDPATSFFASQTGTMEVTVAANGTLSVLVEVVPNGGTCSSYTLGVDIPASFPVLAVTAPNTACQNTAFNLSTTAYPNATYSWSGSGVTASTTNNTTATPVASGTQTYTVTVSTSSGCKSTTASKVVSVNTVPSCPTTFNPSNGQNAVGLSIGTLDWDDVAGATSYLVSFGTNAPNYDNILNNVSVSVSNATIASLSSNLTYGYRITPVNSCGTAVGCPTTTFSTCIPSFTCPINRNVNLNANCELVVPDLVTGLAANPGCGSLTFTQNPTSGTVVSSSHNATVLVTIIPSNPNTPTCTVVLTAKDVTIPSVVCKAFTANLSAGGTVSISTANVFQSGSDNCGTVNQVSVLPNSFTCANLGANTVVLTVNDGNGNATTCSSTVTIVDNTPPIVNCKAFTANLSAGGTASISTADVFQSGSDNCGTVNQISVLPNTFNCANLGTNTVVLTVNDGNGNSNTCAAVVTVADITPPAALCKNINLSLNNAGTVSTNGAAVNNGSSDVCGSVSLALSKTTFNCSNFGPNTVVLTVTDNSSNSATCTSIVTIGYTQPPVAKCRNAIVALSTAGNGSVSPAGINNASTDLCSANGLTLALSKTTFNCSNIGSNVVTLTVTNVAGLSSTCTGTVTVKDLTKPVAKCKAASATVATGGTVTILPSAVNNVSTDACSSPPNLSLAPSSFTCVNAGPNTVILTVSDASNNISTCSTVVTITCTGGSAPEKAITTSAAADYTELLDLFPNPAADKVNIRLSKAVLLATPVQIFDNTGRVVYTGSIPEGTSLLQVDLNQHRLTSGMYLVSVKLADRVQTKSLVIFKE